MRACLLSLVLVCGPLAAQEIPSEAIAVPPVATVEMSVDAAEAAVGDRIPVTLTIRLPAAETFLPEDLGPQWGPFEVLEGDWSEPVSDGVARSWIWHGALAIYRVGEFTIPTRTLDYRADSEPRTLETPSKTVAVLSVLEAAEDSAEPPELANIKDQVSMPADFDALLLAGIGLVGLLLVSWLAWWLHRRYASKLAAIDTPLGLFDRIPPHRWVYGELQHLLEQRLPERGEVDRFYAQLSRIVRRYLGGRYRVELMELTSAEIPDRLAQAGATDGVLGRVRHVLDDCDAVKFAAIRPTPEAWKSIVEEIYRVVDTTKPQSDDSERGAA